MRRIAAIGLAGVATLVAASSFLHGQSAQPTRPNIVVIVSDDMGYADIGIHGSRDIPTPHIDAMAKSGTRFTDAYVTGPYCSPTRAGFLTGRYPQRFGHEFNLEPGPGSENLGLPLSERTLADRLKGAGYRTALFGKWHLGSGDAYHPQSRGFDEFFGFIAGQHSYVQVGAPDGTPILDGRKVAAPFEYLTDTLADRAADFVQKNRTRPFFLYLAFNAVHTPLQASSKYLSRFAGIADERRRTYAAMLSAMDDGIGRTMAALKDAGVLENTLVIFFNDNGGPTMAGTTINGSSNAPLRGSKRQTWEGGIRVPFIVQWTGRLPAGRVDRRPIIQLDVMPTALAAAGVAVPADWKLDGVNLLPFLSGQNPAPPHDALFWRLGNQMAIRMGDWKLVKTSDGPLQTATPETFTTLSTAGLYNLADDIGEIKDLSAREPAKVRELTTAWQRWNKQLVAPLWLPRGGGGG